MMHLQPPPFTLRGAIPPALLRMAAMRFFVFLALTITSFAAEIPLSLTLQSRSPAGRTTLTKEQWLPSRTAIIVCDMWDLHHCKNAVTREGEMASRFNEVLEKARKRRRADHSCAEFLHEAL